MYQQFAEVYDEFMQDVPYAEWADYVESLWKKHSPSRPELVLDLGCGTGNLTLELSKRGYDMIGIDQSEDMLMQAQEKQCMSGKDPILFLCQDMRSFELYGTVDSIISTCDCLNYLLKEEELLQTFRLANNYLNPGGLFIFDLNTEYKFAGVQGEATRAEVYDDAAYIWENHYDPETRINEYAVTFFEKEGRHYERYDEVHEERAYSVETIQKLLEQAGMKVTAVYDAFTQNTVTPTSERICFVAAEQGKRKKD